MGLDSVELVMEFEDAFGISIPDDDAAVMRTPRDVTDYVHARVQTRDSNECLTRDAFFDLRNALRKVTADDQRWRPSTELWSVLPKYGHARDWRDLQAHLGEPLPRLQRPPSLVETCVILTLAAGVWAWIESGWFLVGLVVCIVSGVTFGYGTRPFARRIPRVGRVNTLGKLAERIAERRTERKPPGDTWTREEVRLRVRDIVKQQIGVQDFDDDDSFVDDLGVD